MQMASVISKLFFSPRPGKSIMGFFISLLSFLACIMVASLLTKIDAYDFLKNRSARFKTLDGLRGFLAISVVIHHFALTYHWKITGKWDRPQEDFYQNYGKVGVAIFFMITGFLFILKIKKSNNNIDWLKLFESRIFRIIPLYVFAMLIMTLMIFSLSNFQMKVGAGELAKQYLKWGLFHGNIINDYRDTRLLIAGVDWTLKYEWLFYFSLPILALIFHRGGKAWIYATMLLVIAGFFRPVFFGQFTTEFFIFFAIGGIASYLLDRDLFTSEAISSKLVSTVSLLSFLASIFYPKTLDFTHILFISTFFLLTVLGNNLFGILTLKSAILLGEISFSIYLLHGLVLYFLFTSIPGVDITKLTATQYSLLMPILCALVTAISSITFLLIEKPFIIQGQKYFWTRIFKSYLSK
ncbi:MAG: acyltransferase [Rubrivivax sp.]|nr:MAG: acyltransferase [Rubrivivax sp.]